MSRSDVLSLWTRFLDGDALAPAEREALQRGLEQDAGLAEVARADWALDGQLRSRAFDAESGRRFTAGVGTLLTAQADDGRFSAGIKARLGRSGRWRRRAPRVVWTRVALAASVLLAAFAAWRWQAGPQKADLPLLVAEQRELPAGSRLTATHALELRWRDGTTAAVGAGATLTVGEPALGKRLDLDTGRLRISAAPQPTERPLIVRSALASATVVGTVFTFDVRDGSARLEVEHGAVRFARPDGEAMLVGLGEAAVADAFGVRAPGQPVFAWSPGSAGAVKPVGGRIGNAPDGRPCLVAQADQSLMTMTFTRPGGLFAYDPALVVRGRVWIGPTVRWAGFYVQDYEHHHHAQWHLPLDHRGAWRDFSFTLAELVPTGTPMPERGDALHILTLQAQFAPDAELFLDHLTIAPAVPGAP
jgi:hypothetical protein